MSNLEDGQSNIIANKPFADRTAKALASIERDKLKRERGGVLLGMAAGGFGEAASGQWLATTVKYIPLIAAAGFTVLAVYALGLAIF